MHGRKAPSLPPSKHPPLFCKTGFYQLAPAGIELAILLPLPPRYLDYRHVLVITPVLSLAPKTPPPPELTAVIQSPQILPMTHGNSLFPVRCGTFVPNRAFHRSYYSVIFSLLLLDVSVSACVPW